MITSVVYNTNIIARRHGVCVQVINHTGNQSLRGITKGLLSWCTCEIATTEKTTTVLYLRGIFLKGKSFLSFLAILGEQETEFSSSASYTRYDTYIKK